MSKKQREIFDKLGIQPVRNQVPVQDVDIFQERVRENYGVEQEVRDKIEENLQYRVDEVKSKRDQILEVSHTINLK